MDMQYFAIQEGVQRGLTTFVKINTLVNPSDGMKSCVTTSYTVNTLTVLWLTKALYTLFTTSILTIRTTTPRLDDCILSFPPFVCTPHSEICVLPLSYIFIIFLPSFFQLITRRQHFSGNTYYMSSLGEPVDGRKRYDPPHGEPTRLSGSHVPRSPIHLHSAPCAAHLTQRYTSPHLTWRHCPERGASCASSGLSCLEQLSAVLTSFASAFFDLTRSNKDQIDCRAQSTYSTPMNHTRRL
jgi:hypothetical protein